MKKKQIAIDSTNGGNGDVWMRLVGFYAMADLLPGLKIEVLIPPFLRSLARFTFGDRLSIVENGFEKIKLQYSGLGLRDLLKGIAKGNRYVMPYQRAVIHDKKNRLVKDSLNIMLFNIANAFGLVHLPAWNYITLYQGYLDVIGIPAFKKIGYDQFVTQLKADYKHIYAKLQHNVPVSPPLNLPFDLQLNTLVFPTGTSRQFIPAWWAKAYLPDAYYAFFFKDKDALKFEELGLKIIYFYEQPGDIILLSQQAGWTISTDSFPSHLLQYASKRCTITITEVLQSRIISPVFEGLVVDSQASCHPCLHLDRKNHPTCVAGYTECINWKHEKYIADILKSVPSIALNDFAG